MKSLAELPSLRFRGAQLDLARQPENVDYIKSFTDFISQYDYNYLVLYLEGRIKTKSFPYKKDSESYFPDDIKRIVDYAGRKNIDVVPVVSAFGHAEHFLACQELEHLAELRGNIQGRFSKFKHVFCPSLKETNEFLEAYFTEISELFPSKYFHAGFDEVWDIGYCELCKERLHNETQSDIFKKQILDCYNIVSTKLKKKMIIWDDLFDIYPDAIMDIPRDVVMCSWHYNKLLEKPMGHCGGPGKDIAAFYEKLGFEYIFAPGSFSIRNVETLSKYAMEKKTLGALLTSWELETGFLIQNYPTVAYAGWLWSGKKNEGKGDILQENVIKKVTGCSNDEQVRAIRAMLNSRLHTLPASLQLYMRGELMDEEYERKAVVSLAQSILKPYIKMPTEETWQSYILNDIAVCTEIESLYFEIREIIPGLYSISKTPSIDKELKKQTESCIEKLKSLKTIRTLQWEKYRKGVSGRYISYYDNLIEMLQNALDDSKKVKAVLNVKFQSCGGKLDILIRYQNENEWEKVAEGGFNVSSYNGIYKYTLPVYTDKIPAAARLEASGYVGSAIVFFEYKTENECFVPESFSNIEGNVEHPENLLENGRDWCFLGDGEQDARRKFNNPFLGQVKNVVQMNLKKGEY